jgi:hypothetical protein
MRATVPNGGTIAMNFTPKSTAIVAGSDMTSECDRSMREPARHSLPGSGVWGIDGLRKILERKNFQLASG